MQAAAHSVTTLENSVQLQNLHAMVVGVSHHDAPVAVDGNAALREVELS